MKKKFLVVLSFVVFLLLSAFQLNPSPKEKQYRSADLTKRVVQDGDIIKTDFLDADGKVAIASDFGYATVIQERIENGTIEKYYDDKGNPMVRYPGYYGRIREYQNKNYRIVYLDINGEPVNLLLGYCKEEHLFQDQGKIETICFYDINGRQVYSLSDGFIKQNEYDENGKLICTFHLDESGKRMKIRKGYSKICLSYYTSNDIKNGKTEYEFYFDEEDKPVSLSLGEYGKHWDYEENGTVTVITYLDSCGEPVSTNQGYTTIRSNYQGNAYIERYYDSEGNPFSLSEGQFGIRKEEDQIIYLNEKGIEKFNLKRVLYNYSWIVIIIAIMMIALSIWFEKRQNAVLLILYIVAIIYFTLLYRDVTEKTTHLSFFWSFKQFFSNNDVRAGILKNIWLFIPLGAFLYRLYPHKKMLLIPVILSVAIELIQLITKTGYCDPDDIICNLFGAYIGFCITDGLSTIVSKRNNNESLQMK